MKNSTQLKVYRMACVLGLLALVASFLFPAEYHQALSYLHLGAATGGVMAGCAAVGNIVGEDCGSNPGGLSTLYLIRRRDVDTFPTVAADGVTLSGPIVPKTGKFFAKWDFAQDTGELNHSTSGDAGNKSVKHEVNTYVPRGNATIDSVVNNAINGDYIVVVEDSLGVKRVGGNKLRGMIFDHDYKSGVKGNDKNGTAMKFAGEGLGHVPLYYGDFALPVAP